MASRAGSVTVQEGHKHAKGGCTQRGETYGPDVDTGAFLRRCRDCNIEWWEWPE
jgi:hypothetical protein